MKILAEQLTGEQQAYLAGKVAEGIWQPSEHFLASLARRHISMAKVRCAIRFGRLVAFSNDTKTRRVLLKDEETGVCVVLDLDTKEAVTIYANNLGDTHATLDRSQYVQTAVPDYLITQKM